MEGLVLFKIIQLIIGVTFAVSISDLRRKKGVTPLINERLTVAMKVCYHVPVCIYVYILATLDQLLVSDFIALVLILLGTLLATKAKIDLGKHHTWTGYRLETTKFVTEGVYAFCRHPLYTGIYVCIFGALLTLIPHAPWFLTTVVLITLVYIMVLLVLVARQETTLLAEEFGGEFLEYQGQVHPFLPLRKLKR